MEANMKKGMDSYILNHNIQLQTTMEEIKNEIRTKLFINLQNEKKTNQERNHH